MRFGPASSEGASFGAGGQGWDATLGEFIDVLCIGAKSSRAQSTLYPPLVLRPSSLRPSSLLRSLAPAPSGGEGHQHRGALADLGLHIDLTAVVRNDAVNDGQTEAGAARERPVERLEKEI